MKRIIPFALFLFCVSNISFAQNTNNVKKNSVSFESGIFHHGLFGLGYDRNFLLSDRVFIALNFSGGLGLGFTHSNYNQYYSFSPTINTGGKNVYFFAGPQIKYVKQGRMILNGDLLVHIPDNTVYEGLGVGGIVGLNLFSKVGFTFKIHSALTYLTSYEAFNKMSLGTGISIGYNF